jgi:hypothetical protein
MAGDLVTAMTKVSGDNRALCLLHLLLSKGARVIRFSYIFTSFGRILTPSP